MFCSVLLENLGILKCRSLDHVTSSMCCLNRKLMHTVLYFAAVWRVFYVFLLSQLFVLVLSFRLVSVDSVELPCEGKLIFVFS